MSLRQRLLNIARAELSAAQRRLFPRSGPDDPDDVGFEEPRHPPPGPPVDDPLDTAYRDLELPRGAPVEEARQAYRRLMKRYHPDRFADPAEKAAATRLARGLREAYDRIAAAHEGTRSHR